MSKLLSSKCAQDSRISPYFLKRLSSWLVLSTALTLAAPSAVRAADRYWDADGNPVGNNVSGAGLGNLGGGPFLWNTSALTWWDGIAADAAWINGSDTAIFTGTAGTVTLGSAITAGGLTFNVGGYTLAGGGFALTLGGALPTVTVTNAATLATIQSDVVLNANAVLGGAGNLTINTGVISGAFGFNKLGNGTLTLAGANTFSGAVVLRGGVTSIGAANHLGDGSVTNTLTLAGGTLQATNSFSLGTNRGPIIGLGDGIIDVTGANNLTVNGTLSVDPALVGGVILTKAGTGTLTLSGTNSAAAIATTVNGGVLSIASNVNLGSGRVTLNGGTLQSTGTTTITNGINLGTAGGTIGVSAGQTLQVGTTLITGPGSLTKTDTGTLQINIASTYAGSTTISDGTLAGGVTSFLPAGTQLSVASAGTLNLNGFATTVASISGAGNITNTGAAVALTLGNTLGSQNTTFSGSFNATTAANLTLTKTAGGTLTITSATPGTANGAWTLNAGTVNVDYTANGSATGNILTSRAMSLTGGTLQITGRSGATVTQGLGAITIGARGGQIVLVPSGGTSTTLALGTLTHPTTAGASLLINAPTATTVTTTTATLTLGIMGGRYIYTDGTNYDWATNNGVAATAIKGLGFYTAQYSALATTAGTDTNNSTLTGSATLTGARTTNTLKLLTSGGSQSLNLDTFALSLTAGGLLFTGANDYSITGTTGTLQSNTATTGDLIVHQYGAGVLTIGAIIKDGTTGATALTKAGAGTLALTGVNTFTGAIFVNGGTLSVSNNNQLGTTATAAITINDAATFKTTADVNTGTHTYSLTGGNATFDVGAATTLTVGGVISGAGGLTLNGNSTGILSLTAAATYTGPTFVNSGTLQGGVASFLNSTGAMLNVASGALVNLNAFAATVGGIAGAGNIVNSGASAILTVGGNNLSTTYSGVLQASGTAANFALTKNGSGVLTLTNNNLNTGTTTLNYGTIKFGTSNALAATAIVLHNASASGIIPAVLDLDGNNWTSAAITFYGTSSTAVSQASINIGTGGTLTLGGTVTATVNATAANGFQPAFITGGTLDLGTTSRTFAIADSINAAADLTITSAITSAGGAFGITKTGAGTLLLTGANTYTGTTTVNGAGGVLALGGAGTLGATTNALTMTAGILDLNGTNQAVGAFSGVAAGTVRNSATGTRSTFTSGNGTLITSSLGYAGTLIDGGGTLALVKSGAGILTLTGANTYTGGTQVNDGILIFGNTSAQSASGTTQVASIATLGLGVGGAGFYGVADVDSLFANTLANVNLTAGASVGIDTTAGDFDYTTSQSAARQLVKLGTNILTLSGTSTYTGGTLIAAGTLAISSNSNLGAVSGGLTLLTGTTLRVTGTGNPTTNRALTLAGTSTFDVTDAANTFTISSNFSPGGNVTKTGAGALTLSGTVTTATNIAVTGGTLNVTGTIVGSAAASLLTYGTVAGNAIVNVSNDMTLFGTRGGGVAGAVSVYNQTAGTVTVTPTNAQNQYVASAGYGYFNLTGGTYKASTTAQRFNVTAGAATAGGVAYIGGSSTLDFTGGEYFMVAYNGTNTLGQFTVADTASVIHSNATQPLQVFWTSTGAYGVFNMAGGSFDNTGKTVTFGGGVTNNATGFANLAAGTLTANGFTSNTSTGTGDLTYINFAGGTYRAGAAQTLVGADGSGNIITTTMFGPINNSAVGGPSFAGGTVIDTNGFAVLANRALTGATGFGVNQAAISIPGAGNSGYIGAPAVQFSAPSGGGVPATGYALISGGLVTGIVITNPGTYALNETPTITLSGGGGNIAPFITSALATANTSGGLTKTGAGTLTLSAVNTYTGATTINGGTLSVAPTALPNTGSLAVGSTGDGTFDLYQDGVGATWTMAAGASITLGGASTSGSLGFQLDTIGASDKIVLSGGGTVTVNASGGFLNATALGGFGLGSYTVISGASSISGPLQLGSLPSGYAYTLTTTSSTATINVLSAAAAGNLYWTGDVNGSWSQAGVNTNWSTTANGLTDPGYTPGASNIILFSANNASTSPISTTLDNTVSILGLKFINSLNTGVPTGAVTIAAGTGGSLTIGTSGIEVQAGAPASTTISAPVAFGSAQTWNVADSGSLLTVSGVLSGGLANSTQASPGINVTLTITGAGAVAITGTANTFTGDILVDGGTLNVTNDRSWGGSTVASTTSHTVTLINGGKLAVPTAVTVNPGALTTTNYNLVQIGSGGGIIDTVSGANLTLDDPGQFIGSGDLTKIGLGTLFLSGAQTYTGANVNVNNGVLRLNNSSALGTTAKTLNLGDTTGSNSVTLQIGTSSSLTIPAAVSVVVRTGSSGIKTIAATNTSSTNTINGTITLNDNVTVDVASGGNLTFAGIISGAGIIKENTGTLTLGAVANTFSGGLTIRAGTVVAGSQANTLGANANIVTLGHSSGSENTTLTFVSSQTYQQPIVVASGNTGVATIIGGNSTGTVVTTGGITLNTHALILTKTGSTGSYTVSTNPITGTGNLTLSTSGTTGTMVISAPLNQSGTVTSNGTGSGNTTISGAIGSGISNITQNSATSMLVLSGTSPNFAGTVTITTGTLQLGGAAALNAANAVSVASGAIFNVNASGTIGGLSGLGMVTNTGTAKTLTLGGSGTYTFDGVITATTPANLALTAALTGGGSQTLTGQNLYTGATTVNRGTLVLDFNASSLVSDILFASSPLVLGGGTLSVIGDPLATSQTFASTALTTVTSSQITATPGAGGLTLNLGALTRNAASALNFNVTGSPAFNFTGPTITNGVITSTNGVAFATLNNTDWANLSGSNVIAAVYALNDFSSPASNVNVTGSPAWTGTTVNTLRFNTGTPTLTLTGANTLSAGGLLVGSGAGAVTISGTGTLAGSPVTGTVAAPVIGELGIFQNSASTTTISAAIVNNATSLSHVAATPSGTALNKYGTGTLVLSSTKNAYTGGTNLANGILRLGASEVIPDGASQPGAVTVATTATLDLNGFSETINGLAGTGTVDNTSATAVTLYVGSANATSTFAGSITQSGGGVVSLNKTGTGTLTLTGANTYTGATTISGGSNTTGLTLNFTAAGAPLSNIISASSALNVGSALLTLTGSTVANSQTFNGTTLSGGARITIGGTTPAVTLNLGAITRAAGSGASVNLTIPATSTVTTSNSIDATGILGSWIILNSADFAEKSGSNIVAYTGYTAITAATGAGSATQNARFDAGTSIGAAITDYNTVKLGTLVAIPFGATGNILRLGATGAILVPTGAAASSFGATAGSGVLTAGGAANTAGELNLINWSANTLTINSAINDNGTGVVTLVKSGSGAMTLATGNGYTGGTIINQGTLTASAQNQLSTGTITLNGGTLTFSADTSLTNAITLGAGGGTLNLTGSFTSARTFGAAANIGTSGSGPRVLTVTGGTDVRQILLQSNIIDGAGGATSLVLSLGGDLRILRLSGTNTYTGTTTITRGILDFSAVTQVAGGITSAATTGNILFAATGATRAILQNSVAIPITLTRSLGYGDGQIHWEGNGGFSNDASNTTWAINLGGAGQQVVWGAGGFVPTGSILQFGVTSITNTVTTRGAVDFQNDIDLGGALRTIESASANNKLATSPYDVLLSGDLSSSSGGGINKTGAGVMILTGNNSASATTSVTLTAGGLVFGSLAAIPGSGANLTLSTTAGGNSFIGLAGDTNPIATFGSRITNASTATSAFTLGADSSANLDFTAYPNMRLAAYAFGLPAKAITYSGTITPASSTYLFGGSPYAGSATNTLATELVLSEKNALTGGNALNMTFGNLTLLNANNFTGGTTLSGNGIGNAVIAVGSNAALGTGTVTLTGASTQVLGAVNGDKVLANNIAWAGSATSFIAGADTANDGVSGTTNGGGLTYVGTITISSTATAPTIISRTGHQVLLLGDINNGILTTGLTYSGSTAGLTSSLATAANGGVAKNYNGLNIINDATTLVIDDDAALGTSGNGLRLGSSTATSTLRIQPGVASVTLNSTRLVTMRGDSNQVIQVGRGSTLTIAGVIAGGTNTAGRTLTKADPGTLVIQNKNTYAGAASLSSSLVIRGGTLQLDSGSGSFTAATDRFFADASNALDIAFSAATGTYAGGGTLEIIQASGNAFALTQGFGNLTFNTGANTVKLTNNNTTRALTLNLGSTFTRTALLGGTVNFATSTLGGTNTIGSSVAITNGIIAGYATFNGVDWATQSGGSIIALPGLSYTSLVAASNSATANFVLATGTVALSTANASVNSLKLVGSAGGTNVTLNGTMTVTSRGILFDNTSGSASISGGTQLGVTGTEIIAHTYGGGDITTNKLTLNGVIKGSATVLTKAGPGTLVLSGVNTYTGSLIINEGVVEYANGSAGSQNLGAPTAAATNILLNGGILRQTATNNLIYGITVNSYAKLDVPTSVTLTQTAQGITGKAGVAGILQKTGDGTLTFSGTTDNPSLSLEVVGGVVNLGKTSTATAHSVGVAAGSTAAGTMGAALIIGNGTTVNITGTGNDQIHDQSSVVVKSTGVFNLGGGAATAESFDSLAGTGSVTNTGLTGTFILTLGAGNNVNVSAYSVAAADAGMSATGLNNFGGVLSDGGVGKVLALTKIGSGTQILSGLSTYSGATNINAGTLQLGITNALPSGAGKGDVNIVGNGYGAGTINGGTSIGTADKILAPGTLDLGGFDQAINGLNSTTGGYVVNNPTLSWNGSAWVAAASTKVLSLGHGDASGSFNGVIMNGYTVAPGVVTAQAYVGTLALTKTGTGTQTLAGFNTYTGATIVEQGTLLVSGSLGGTTSVDVLNGATLGGTGSINTAATVTVESDGTLSPGASIGTLSSGSVSLLSGSIFKLEINTTATTTDRSAITGNLSLALTNDAVLSISDLAPAPIGSGTFAFITYTGSWNGGLFKFEGNTIADDGFLMVSGNSYLLDYNFGGNSVALLAVPEPGAITSLLGGLGLLVGLQRFRRRGAPARA